MNLGVFQALGCFKKCSEEKKALEEGSKNIV